MGLVEDVLAARRGPVALERAWPVGAGAVLPFDQTWGHDDTLYSPESYLDYAVTSNEVFSAAMLRARLMSSLRLQLFRGDDAAKRAMPNHPASALLRYVNPFWTSARLARMDELCMCLLGESYWAIEPGPDGKPAEIWWLKPSRVRPVPDEKNYLRRFLYQPIRGQTPIPFEPHEIVWFRYPNPLDEFSALSPLAAARLAADAASAMMKSNRNLFNQGLQLAGLVVPSTDKVTFSTDQANELEEKLLKRFSGADKAHRWAVLRYEAQFKQMSLSPKDAEFAVGLNLTLRQVANAYGIPVPLLNDMSSATLANVDGFTKALWAHTLVPDSALRAEEIVEQYLPRFGRGAPDHAEYDYGAVPALQESMTETWTRDAQALDRGALTINEWRRRNGMPDVEWGDEPWLPLNKAQYVDGQLVVSQTPVTAPANQPPPQQLPDDEVNPANQPVTPKAFDHHAARRLLTEVFTDPGGGVSQRVNGHAVAGC